MRNPPKKTKTDVSFGSQFARTISKRRLCNWILALAPVLFRHFCLAEIRGKDLYQLAGTQPSYRCILVRLK